MKILFLASAYHKAEAFASVCKGFEALGHQVTYYPLYMRLFEHGQTSSKGMKVDEAVSNKMGRPALYEEVALLSESHDLALVWKGETLPHEVIRDISKNLKTIYYSWDDPYQLEVEPTAVKRAVACGIVASCCERSVGLYKMMGAQKALWIPPGYDPEVHFEDGKPEVDVCFIGTNTYCSQIYGTADLKASPFDRRDLVRSILNVTKSLELWGCGDQPLGWLHSQHGDPSLAPYYKGFIPFDQARKAYSRARVCINSHVRRNGLKYFNERTFQIMGCSRLQMIDRNSGTEEFLKSDPSVAITYGSLSEFEDQLRSILSQKVVDIPHMLGRAAYEFSKEYTWTKFCAKILEACK